MHKVKRAIIMAAGIGKTYAASKLAYTEAVNKSKWSANDRYSNFGTSSKWNH